MEKAIELALKSGTDVPIAAIVVKDGKIIASAHNEKESTNDTSAHAEILAIKRAGEKLKNWRLDTCEIYITLEPCPMCTWAILQSRISKVYFGTYDIQYGALGSALDLRHLTNSNLEVYGGILEEKCDNVIEDFWNKTRKSGK